MNKLYSALIELQVWRSHVTDGLRLDLFKYLEQLNIRRTLVFFGLFS